MSLRWWGRTRRRSDSESAESSTRFYQHLRLKWVEENVKIFNFNFIQQVISVKYIVYRRINGYVLQNNSHLRPQQVCIPSSYDVILNESKAKDFKMKFDLGFCFTYELKLLAID